MASYTVASGEVGAHAKTLAAATADTVTFTDDVSKVEVVTDGAAALYVRVDGTAPTVGGAASHYLPAFASAKEITVPLSDEGTVEVKLISAGTPTYSVARA